MQIFKHDELELPSSVLTIGAFDGLHLGHQSLIKQAVKSAEHRGVSSVVYTFDPPPHAFFQDTKILQSVDEKVALLRKFGVDYTIIAEFNEIYASRLPSEFIHEIKSLTPSEIIVGSDFTFDKGQQGDIDLLADHFNVHIRPFLSCEKGERISSTRIRGLVGKHEFAQASKLLGRP